MSSNISVDTIKDFIKNNIVICILGLICLILFIMMNSYGNSSDKYSNQLDQVQLKVKKLETELGQLKTVNSDLESLNEVEQKIWDKCLNFGKKTSLYKFINKVNTFLGDEQNLFNANLTSAYNLTKKRTISLEQDVSEFQGDYILGEYTMSFKATFSQLLSFLKQMQEMNHFIQLKQVDIKALNTENIEELTINLVYRVLGKIKIKEEEAHA